MVAPVYEPLRPPREGMTDKELFRWFFEVYRKTKELEERIKVLEPTE